jgi:hypothetical protein
MGVLEEIGSAAAAGSAPNNMSDPITIEAKIVFLATSFMSHVCPSRGHLGCAT